MGLTHTVHRQFESLLWDAKAVARALQIGERTLWRWISAGEFPPPDISKGGKIRRWKRTTVLSWIDSQKGAVK